MCSKELADAECVTQHCEGSFRVGMTCELALLPSPQSPKAHACAAFLGLVHGRSLTTMTLFWHLIMKLQMDVAAGLCCHCCLYVTHPIF